MDVTGEKQKSREFYMTARKNLPAADAARFSLNIAKNVFSLPRVQESELIMIYHKLGSEADMSALMEMIIRSGRGAALPYCRADGNLGAGRIFDPNEDLIKGRFGTMEPADRLKGNINAERLGAIVCPGVAFDKTGGRLGRGGGHYDRLLRQIKGKTFVVGCAFDCQISGAPLPREEHDAVMDAVTTESGTFYANGGGLA